MYDVPLRRRAGPQGRTGQGRTGQDRTGQGRARCRREATRGLDTAVEQVRLTSTHTTSTLSLYHVTIPPGTRGYKHKVGGVMMMMLLLLMILVLLTMQTIHLQDELSKGLYYTT